MMGLVQHVFWSRVPEKDTPFHAQRLGLRLGRAPQASVSVSRAWMMGALSA